MTTQIGSAEFDQKVLQASGPVLVDFFATWCGPCKIVAPIVEQVAAEKAGQVAVYKVDVDQAPDIASRYGIMSIPTLIVFENGQVKNHAVGVQPKDTILSMLA